METLVSTWYNGQASVSEKFFFPDEIRPGKQVSAPVCKTLPVVDLSIQAGHGRAEIIQQMLQAGREFGFFEVINHGVSNVKEATDLCKLIFDMPVEDRASLYSTDLSKGVRLYTSGYFYDVEEHHYWRDILRLPCHPLEDLLKDWPEKPDRFKEVVGAFSQELRSLGYNILNLIGEGLGLEQGFFKTDYSKSTVMNINRYPPCPEPSLTLGTHKHSDPNLLSILYQGDVYGLQLFKDGECFGIEPLPDAFVINIAWQLQVRSNGKLRTAEHRAITNPTRSRTTVGVFIGPSYDCLIEPVKALISETSPQLYRAYKYSDFFDVFAATEGVTEEVNEAFRCHDDDNPYIMMHQQSTAQRYSNFGL